MNVSDFDYELPPERIAQQPAGERDASRLLVLERGSGATTHRIFREIVDELQAGDLLVLNDTRVLPARLFARKPTGGRVEVLLVEPLPAEGGRAVWRALVSASKSLGAGARLRVTPSLDVEMLEREGSAWQVELHADGDPARLAWAAGTVPLPPYIERSEDDPRSALDRERYQTVYARAPGAVAAPTAGLHFTVELLDALRARGVGVTTVTLHIGPGTFLPVRTADVEAHTLHEEAFELPGGSVEAIHAARERGGRVVAVGTSVARTLEASASPGGALAPGKGRTSLYIYPGYRFRVVDALVTNFHLPRSTLLMLVCALAGTKETLAAYRDAVRRGYRFYSYGDAMLVRGARA